MFKNEFQGGPYVEVFSSQGKEPLAKWKLSGQTSIQKSFDKECKSYIHTLEGASTTTKIQLPKDSKQALVLIQRYLVIQYFVPLGQDFSMELGVTDMGSNKRRLFFSTAQKDTSATPLHAKVPLTIIKRAVWLNLSVDMVSLVGDLFRGQTFKSLDTIIISACCKLRKIFTLKEQPPDTTDDDELYDCTPLTNSTADISSIPKACQFSSDVPHLTQVLSMSKLRHAEFKLRGDSSRPPSSNEPDLNSSLRAKDNRPTHIAFGTKVFAPQTSSGRKVSASGQREGSGVSGSRTSRSSHSRSPRSNEPLNSARGVAPPMGGEVNKLVVHGHTRQKSDPGSEIDNPNKVDKGTLSGSNTWSASGVIDDPSRQPHPPRENSGGRSRRVVRVRPTSGKKAGETGRSDASESSDVDHTSVRGRQTELSSASARNKNKSDVSSSGMQNTMGSGSAGRHRTRLDSLSESDDHQEVGGYGRGSERNASGGRSRIPRRKKKERSSKMAGLSGSVREEEVLENSEDGRRRGGVRNNGVSADGGIPQVQSGERVAKNGDDVNGKIAETDSGIAVSMETSEPEGSHSSTSNRSVKADGKDKNALYTFMSPPHTVPVRPAEHSRQLDPKKLQMKMQAIIDSKTPTRLSEEGKPVEFDPSKESSRDLISPETDFLRNALLNDDSDLEDDHPAKPRAIVERSRSPKDRTITESQRTGDSVGASVKSSSSRQQPAQSLSPTLRRSKLVALERSQQGGGGGGGAPPRGSMSRMSIRSNRLKEIPKDDPRLSEDYDWRKYQSNNSSLASSLEANMLASLRRQQLEELYEERNEGAANSSFEIHNYGDDDESSSSDDTNTTISTWKPPDNLKRGKGYQDEMNYAPTGNPLMQSNPRDWSNLFSPPIVLPSEKLQNEQTQLSPVNEFGSGLLSDGGRHKSTSSESQTRGDTDGEEELDLLYDPCLNCYFDPKTGKYYELA